MGKQLPVAPWKATCDDGLFNDLDPFCLNLFIICVNTNEIDPRIQTVDVNNNLVAVSINRLNQLSGDVGY